MNNFICFSSKSTIAKGLDPNNKIDRRKITRFIFLQDYKNISQLSKTLSKKRSNLNQLTVPEEPLLFYPGSGCDVLFPLLYIEQLFPKIPKMNFLFIDINDNLPLIKTILDEVGISFSQEKNHLLFYWNKTLINLEFRQEDVFSQILTLPYFHIYFERAFAIMKDQNEDYENHIFQKLLPRGILISDHGYHDIPIERIPAPRELSSYHDFVLGIKR